MENLDINVYLGKEDGDTLPAEEWNGALGTVQNKVNELVSDSNTAVDYNKLDSSLKSSIDKANNAVLPSTLTSNYYSKADTGVLKTSDHRYEQVYPIAGNYRTSWVELNINLRSAIMGSGNTRTKYCNKCTVSEESGTDIVTQVYCVGDYGSVWCQTVEGAVSIDGNGQLTAGSKYTKYTRTYTDGDANPSAWEEVGGSGSVEGAVLYDQAQSLTDGQKTLARNNIGAIQRSDIDPNDDILGKIDVQYQTIPPTQDDFGDATEGRIVYTLKTTQSDNTIDHVYFGFPVKRLKDSNGNYHNLYDAGEARGVIDFDTPTDESPGDFFINLNGTLAPIVEQNDGTISNAIYECIQYGRPVSEFEFTSLPIGSVSIVALGAQQGIMYTLTKRGWVNSLDKQLDGVESTGMMVLIA